MTVQHVKPPEMGKPSGFSHAVIAHGRTVFLAGQTALDGRGNVVGTEIVTQFEKALSNLLTALNAAGGSPSNLTSLTVYVVDMDDYRANASAIGKVWRQVVGNTYPAMA